jgi:hypothetical protein
MANFLSFIGTVVFHSTVPEATTSSSGCAWAQYCQGRK